MSPTEQIWVNIYCYVDFVINYDIYTGPALKIYQIK